MGGNFLCGESVNSKFRGHSWRFAVRETTHGGIPSTSYKSGFTATRNYWSWSYSRHLRLELENTRCVASQHTRSMKLQFLNQMPWLRSSSLPPSCRRSGSQNTLTYPVSLFTWGGLWWTMKKAVVAYLKKDPSIILNNWGKREKSEWLRKIPG
jgi:hypothetical protein